MRTRITLPKLLASLLLIAVASAALASDTKSWYTLRVKGSGFQVKMPSKPSSASKWITDDGVTYPAYKFGTVSGDFYYQVSYSDFANVPIQDSQAPQLFQNVIEGMAKVSKSEVIESDAFNVQGHQSHRYVLAGQNKVATVVVIIWANKKAYIVSIEGPAAELSEDVLTTYFNTFKLIAS